MNEYPQDTPDSSQEADSQDYIERQQELHLHQEELRLQQEERRAKQAHRAVIISRLTQGIYVLVGALETLLGLRFVLRLAGANPDNLLAQVIYSWSDPFLSPFANLFGQPNLNETKVMEVNTITAMIIYGILGILAGQLVKIMAD